MKVLEGNFSAGVPPDVPFKLRKLADDIEAGDVEGVVVAYALRDDYKFIIGAKSEKSVVLGTLLKTIIVERVLE